MEKSQDYRDGYPAADDGGALLAGVLRQAMNGSAGDFEEPLTLGMARHIFAGVYGGEAADDEFGPDPSEARALRGL